MAILGLQFNKSKIETLDNIEYGTVGIMTDADCLEESLKVATATGNKALADLTVYDKVLTHDGTFKDITEINEKKIHEFIELELEDGMVIQMTQYEKVPVKVNGEIQYKYAKDLTMDDILLKVI
jgi:preprotein translocase subunit YajC